MDLLQLRSTYQQQRDDAARRRRAAHDAIGGLIGQVRQQGRESLTATEQQSADYLIGQRDTARRQMAALDGQLAELAQLQADEDAYQARAAETQPAGGPRTAGQLPGSGETELRVDGGRPVRQFSDRPRWTRSDGRPAAVERDASVSDHEVAAAMIAQSRSRDDATVAQYGGLGQMVRALSTTGSSGIVPTIWSANIIDRARNAAQVIAAGAETIPMDSKVLQIGRLTARPRLRRGSPKPEPGLRLTRRSTQSS